MLAKTMNLENSIPIDTLHLLNEALSDGIISMDSVLNEIMSSKRTKVKKLHPYSITPPSKDGGRWQTRYKLPDGTYKNIKASSEEKLLDKLIPIYFSSAHIDKMTFHGLYKEWLEYKKTVTSSPNTIKRHGEHYRKYFEPSKLHNERITKIDELFLETECNRIVKDFNLSRKEWCNAKTILNGMFNYAVRKKYLTTNPMDKIKILVKFRQVVKKTGKTETFNSDELADLNSFLDRMYTETEDTSYLAVRLNFFLGLRVGELVALKWSDLSDEQHLHILREEIRNQETNTISVVEHTKTHCDRFVVLVPEALSILRKIQPEGEYVFMRDGKRITTIRISTILRKYARSKGVTVKSSHKIRKTFASILNAAGVPLDCIRESLGHTNLSTTLEYLFNPLTEEQTYNLIASALQTDCLQMSTGFLDTKKTEVLDL